MPGKLTPPQRVGQSVTKGRAVSCPSVRLCVSGSARVGTVVRRRVVSEMKWNVKVRESNVHLIP